MPKSIKRYNVIIIIVLAIHLHLYFSQSNKLIQVIELFLIIVTIVGK